MKSKKKLQNTCNNGESLVLFVLVLLIKFILTRVRFRGKIHGGS